MPAEDTKPVKKEEVETDDDDEKPISLVHKTKKKLPINTPTSQSKVKKEINTESGSKPSKSTPKPTKPKKEELDFDDVKKPKSNVKDDKRKVKKKREEEKKKEEGKKRERKVYDLPGQKRDPPEERDPLRIFYETLYEQKPTSEMAAVWLMESGLLPLAEAKRVYEKKMSGKIKKLTSPIKSAKSVKETKSVTVKKKVEPSTPNTSNKKKTNTETTTVTKMTKKRKAESSSEESDEDSGEEFVLSTKKAVKKVKAN